MNSSSSFSASHLVCPLTRDSTLSTGFKTTAYSLILVLSLFGNSAIIAIVLRDKKMRTITNYWITNMAISDLIFPVVAVPYSITQIFRGGNVWLVEASLGLALCKLTVFLGDVSTAISILSMIFIAVERFCAVKFPLAVATLQPKLKLFIPVTWLVAIALHSPYFYTAKLYSNGQKTFCVATWGPEFDAVLAQRIYFLIIFVLLYGMPLALLVTLYTSIILHLKRTKSPTWNKQQETTHVRLRHKNNVNILKMSVTIVLIFFLCFSPLMYFTFYRLFNVSTCVSTNVLFTLAFFAQSYPAWNPIVYFIFSNNFRNGVRIMFCKSSRKRKRSELSMATSFTRRSFQSFRSRKLSRTSTKSHQENVELCEQNDGHPKNN